MYFNSDEDFRNGTILECLYLTEFFHQGIKVQEYFLGYFKEVPDDAGVFTQLGNVPKTSDEIPTKKIDGIQTPFYKLEMTDGTSCALKVTPLLPAFLVYIA